MSVPPARIAAPLTGRRIPPWAWLPLVIAATFAAAGAGHVLVPVPLLGALSVGSGVVLAVRLRLGTMLCMAAAGTLSMALLVTGASPAQSIAAGAGAALGSQLLALLLGRAGVDIRLTRARDAVLATLGAATVHAPVVLGSALAAGGMPVVAQGAGASMAASAWALLFIVSWLTALPALAAMPPASPAASGSPSHWRSVPWIAALAGCAALALALALSGRPAWALGTLPLVFAATVGLLRHAGTTCASAVVVLLAAGASAAAGRDPSLGGGLLAAVALAGTILLAGHALLAEARWRQRRLESALHGAQLGVADWHLRSGESHASATWRALTNHGTGPWSARGWLGATHHEDRAGLEAAIDDVAAGTAARVSLELRCPAGDGWKWLHATLSAIEHDEDGTPLRLLATVSDAGQLHAAEERERLSANLFQHLHEGLLVTDVDMRVLDVNPAYSQILGVTREELVGHVPMLLRSTAADPIARQQRVAMLAALQATGNWRGELLERRRNGEACTLQATISTVRSPEGEARYHVLIISDITEQQAQRDRLERQAHYDELTRLPNRARLSQLMEAAMRAADRDGYLLVVCYLDLDRFKPVNDRFGHAAGDRLLAELAGRLRGALRSRDQWADSAARLGGDEFVLLLRAGTIDEARLAVERVLRVVAQPYLIDPAEEPVVVTASMGATVYPIDSSDAETLLRHADHAMYGAKQSGRNGYLFFDPEHRRRTEERVMAIGRVQEALDHGEFVLFYQPQIEMRSGRVLGFEALLRWEHPQHGIVAPLQFLPLIENTGLSARVGDWVISQALDHLSQWRRSGLDISVSVNVSARHLQEPDFAQRLAELLARHREPLARHLHLEILETVAHADIESTSALLARCRSIGVQFALDDFGTGYSTLTYLKRLPVDSLKIDRSFVHHMLDDTQDRGIVEGVIGLARTFGCSVCAEGVESAAQARLLLDLGCEIGQGTGIAAPMPAAQVGQWVRDYRGMFALSAAGAAPASRSGPLR